MVIVRTRSPYFSPNRAIAPSALAVSRSFHAATTGMFARIASLIRRAMSSRSSGSIGRSWLKSKRSRSGATSEPRCWTWSPRTARSWAWSRWVAVWLRMTSSRRSPSTVTAHASPTAGMPSTTSPMWTIRPPTGWRASSTSTVQPSPSMTPVSLTWPPAST